jgi:hypothetical protein
MMSPAEAAQCLWVTPETQRAGFVRSGGCGRGSFRLQKLTSSAWPSRPRVKNLWIRRWSSLDVRKHSRGERALEASSPVAKPRARWRAPSGALVDGRHIGSGKALSLTWERTEGLLLSRRIRSPGSAGQDKVCQRQNRTTLHAADNAAARWHRPVRCSALPIGQSCGWFFRSWKHAVKCVSTWGSVSARKQDAVGSL